MLPRQRDTNSGWTNSSPLWKGPAEGGSAPSLGFAGQGRGGGSRIAAIITSGGLIVEWAKYSSYGIPFGLPGGDTDSDGDCDSTDITQIQTWIDAPAYDVRGDINLDGSVNATDKSLAISNYQGTTSGWNVLSAAVVANRIGYAGYQKDINLDLDHVRNRVYSPELGRWITRDPLGYVEQPDLNLDAYVQSSPIARTDSSGLIWNCGVRLAVCPEDDDLHLFGHWMDSSVKHPKDGLNSLFVMSGEALASDSYLDVVLSVDVWGDYPQHWYAPWNWAQQHEIGGGIATRSFTVLAVGQAQNEDCDGVELLVSQRGHPEIHDSPVFGAITDPSIDYSNHLKTVHIHGMNERGQYDYDGVKGIEISGKVNLGIGELSIGTTLGAIPPGSVGDTFIVPSFVFTVDPKYRPYHSAGHCAPND